METEKKKGELNQKNCWHKNLLDEQWRAVDSITHCEKRLPLKYVVFFLERGISGIRLFRLLAEFRLFVSAW